MENDNVPKEIMYAILIAAALDETSEQYGNMPDWMKELED